MNEEREGLLKNLNDALEYAKSVDTIQRHLDAVNDDIYNIETKKGNFIVTIIISILCVVGYCPTAGFMGLAFPDIGWWMFLIQIALDIFYIGVAVVIDVLKNNAKKTKLGKKLPGLYTERDDAKAQLQQIVSIHRNDFKMFPKEYIYPLALEYFINVISSGRADNMKEAMNSYEDQVHKWKMENLAESSLLAQQEAAAIAAFNATVNTVSAAANVATAIHTF